MNISFQPLSEHDYPDFQNDVKNVFSIALIEQFGLPQDKEFFMDDDINETFHNPKLVTYYIYADEKKAGGVALHIDNESHNNRMELFYLYPEFHNYGLGVQVWNMIEEMYPETVVWELITPYFEKRNIHFYVNKCGFQIVEFFCKHHKDPTVHPRPESFHNEYFRFEKQMKR